MDKTCPECNEPMYYEASTKHFICKKCGLYVTREEIYEILDKKKGSKKRSKESEYLEWWLSKK